MKGFSCYTCNNVFAEATLRRAIEEPDDGPGYQVVIEGCPDCGGEDLREVALCVYCAKDGVDTLAVYDDLCAGCATDIGDFYVDTAEEGQFRRDK